MALDEGAIKKYTRRLLLSRMRILCTNGFYGLLLMHMVYSIDESAETAWTDGFRIAFSPDFLDALSDGELDLVMMHEILHVALQHVVRGADKQYARFNTACDIVVNSNILASCGMDVQRITLQEYGELMHVAPDGKEGYLYTAEQVYAMLPEPPSGPGKSGGGGKAGRNTGGKAGKENAIGNSGSSGKSGNRRDARASGAQKQAWDDHSKWGNTAQDDTFKDVWTKRFADAAEAISIRDPSNSRGLLPAFAERMLKELKDPQSDWRALLQDFIQEEVCDYSFSPPDRRFDDSPFFLPDFNEKEDVVKNILFMIDTSASMSDDMITAAYAEIKGAIDQFGGSLRGWLGFFDAAIIAPRPFEDEATLRIIRPVGGGGTDFQIIFEYVARHMTDELPASMVILTDGYAPFPKESLAMGIPVLWLLNNKDVRPPWGKVARINV